MRALPVAAFSQSIVAAGYTEHEVGTLGNPFAEMASRGVWQAPWFGPDGELILVSVTRARRRLREVVIPHGGSRIEAADSLLAELERDDPIPMLRVI